MPRLIGYDGVMKTEKLGANTWDVLGSRGGSVTNIDSQARRLGRRAHVSLGRHHGLTQSQIFSRDGSNMGHGLRSGLLESAAKWHGQGVFYSLSLQSNHTVHCFP